MKRAFETIDRSILLQKLRRYGIEGIVNEWFNDYLSNRKQRVRINEYFSSYQVNNTGVPQGSVLGPLLFILYLNDINLFLDCEFINLFADDTLLACSGTDLEQVVEKMNKVLQDVEIYLKTNKMKLNVTKTKAMIITSKFKFNKINTGNINLILENERIEIVTSLKYLGFQLDYCLSFDDHFEYIKKKISKKLYFFTRIASNLSTDTKITVYRTLVQPHFEYCASILFSFNLNKMQQLQKLQNRGMRIILNCSRSTPISSMLSTLQWLSVSQRLYYCSMIFIYKMLNTMTPTYLQTTITFNKDIHNYSTRNSNNLHIIRTNFRSSMSTIFFKGFVQFNDLPNTLKSIASFQTFRIELIKYIHKGA